MMPGEPQRRTHSYVRHGTTSLFAARDVASGFVLGKCYKRHRAVEFLKFLKEIDAEVPERLAVNIVLDDYATHKTPKIKAWLARRSDYHMHFTPTSVSWINQIGRWFAELIRKQIQRDVHTSVKRLGQTSVPSSTCTTKIRIPSNEPSLLTRLIVASVKGFCHKALVKLIWHYGQEACLLPRNLREEGSSPMAFCQSF